MQNFRDFFSNALTLSIFELEKRFFKQVRILPEIDWYHYQSANAAPMAKVRDRIKTDLFRRSVTSEPTVGGDIYADNIYTVMRKGAEWFGGEILLNDTRILTNLQKAFKVAQCILNLSSQDE